MKNSYFLFYLMALTLLTSFLGCGREPKKPKGLPELHPCAITVTQDGKPLEGAIVRFAPKAGKSEWLVSGQTQSNGIAQIMTHNDFKGVPEGDYKVLIYKIYKTPSQYLGAGKPPVAEDTPEYAAMMAEKLPSFHLIDPKFEKENSSPLEFNVVKGKNAQSFEVGAAVKVQIGH